MKAIAIANLRSLFQLMAKNKDHLYNEIKRYVSGNVSDEINSYKQEAKNLKTRLSELEIIDNKLYENYALGRIKSSRYFEMSSTYEKSF